MRNILVLGPEGSGTRFISETIAKIIDRPVYDYHDWLFKLKVIEKPAVYHVSYPHGRTPGYCKRGTILISERHWPSPKTLTRMADDYFLVKCLRNPKNSIRSAYRRFYIPTEELGDSHSKCITGDDSSEVLEIAITAHVMARGLLSMIVADYDINYECMLQDPRGVFEGFIRTFGHGVTLDEYKTACPAREPLQTELEMKLECMDGR